MGVPNSAIYAQTKGKYLRRRALAQDVKYRERPSVVRTDRRKTGRRPQVMVVPLGHFGRRVNDSGVVVLCHQRLGLT